MTRGAHWHHIPLGGSNRGGPSRAFEAGSAAITGWKRVPIDSSGVNTRRRLLVRRGRNVVGVQTCSVGFRGGVNLSQLPLNALRNSHKNYYVNTYI